MKVYISQPMANRSYEEIMAERNRAIQVVQIYFPGAEILESYFDDYNDRTPMENLARSVSLMAQADLVVLLPMYLGSSGCEIEDHIAQNMGIRRFTINYGFDLQGNYDVHNYMLYSQTTCPDPNGNVQPLPYTEHDILESMGAFDP